MRLQLFVKVWMPRLKKNAQSLQRRPKPIVQLKTEHSCSRFCISLCRPVVRVLGGCHMQLGCVQRWRHWCLAGSWRCLASWGSVGQCCRLISPGSAGCVQAWNLDVAVPALWLKPALPQLPCVKVLARENWELGFRTRIIRQLLKMPLIHSKPWATDTNFVCWKRQNPAWGLYHLSL